MLVSVAIILVLYGIIEAWVLSFFEGTIAWQMLWTTLVCGGVNGIFGGGIVGWLLYPWGMDIAPCDVTKVRRKIHNGVRFLVIFQMLWWALLWTYEYYTYPLLSELQGDTFIRDIYRVRYEGFLPIFCFMVWLWPKFLKCLRMWSLKWSNRRWISLSGWYLIGIMLLGLLYCGTTFYFVHLCWHAFNKGCKIDMASPQKFDWKWD